MNREVSVVVKNLRTLALWALGAYVVYRLAEYAAQTLFIFGFAIFLAFALDRPIRSLDRRGFRRGVSVTIIVVVLLGAIAAGIAVSIRPVMRQVQDVAMDAPSYAASIERRIQSVTGRFPYIEKQLGNGDVGRWVSAAGERMVSSIGRFSMSALGAIVTAVVVLVTALYAVLDPKPLVRGVVMAAPRRYQRVVLRIIVGTARQVQAWVVATFWLMLIVGISCGLGLWALGVKSPLLFGILAGIGEAVPTIGPILTAIPPALVAFAHDPIKAVYVLLLFLAVQQLEQHLLVPKVMAAALKLHPVSVLFFVVALGTLLGPAGVLLATPLCATVKVIYNEMREDARRYAEKKGAQGGDAT